MKILLGNNISADTRQQFTSAVLENPDFSLVSASLGNFPSKEAFGHIRDTSDIKGEDVLVVQSLGTVHDQTADNYAMELLFAVDNLHALEARAIWVIAPFLAYARQDKPGKVGRESIGIDTFCRMLKAVGASGISTIDIHSQEALRICQSHFGENGAFNLLPTDSYTDYLRRQGLTELSIGGPDAGAHDRAAAVADAMGADRFHVQKTREGAIAINDSKLIGFEGHVAGMNTAIVDDMFDSGGTATNCGRRLKEEGASTCTLMGAHGVFSNGAVEKLHNAKMPDGSTRVFDRVVITDTIDPEPELQRLERQYPNIRETYAVLPQGSRLVAHAQQIAQHPVMRRT